MLVALSGMAWLQSRSNELVHFQYPPPPLSPTLVVKQVEGVTASFVDIIKVLGGCVTEL